MDERPKYEQLIGGKLQSLPVPDMQDAIWARVKTQLDLDMPTDDGDGGSSPQSPSGPQLVGWGLSLVVIALITIFLFNRNKAERPNDSAQPTTTEQTVSPPVQNNSPPSRTNNTGNNIIAPVTPGAPDVVNRIGNDSVIADNPVATIPFANDTASAAQPAPGTIAAPPTDTTTSAPRRGRGMTGLNDSSYRIVPKNGN